MLGNGTASSNFIATEDFHLHRTLLASVLALIILIGGSANVIVAMVMYKQHNMRTNIASMFLINLLIIDILNLFVIMPFSASSIVNGEWKQGGIFMQFSAFVGTSLELASMLALAVVSLDRLAAVMKPLVYRAKMTNHKAFYLNTYVWTQAILFSVIPLPLSWYAYNQHYGLCTFVSNLRLVEFYVYMVISFVFNFLVSLMIILITYFYIFRVARSHSKRISCAIQPSKLFSCKPLTNKIRTETFRQREIRTASKILFVIGAFVICHLPYAMVRTYDLFTPYRQFSLLSETLTIGTKCCAFSKSAFDPFIYFILQKRFQKAFLKTLLNKKTMRKRMNAKMSIRTSGSAATITTKQTTSFDGQIDEKNKTKALGKGFEKTPNDIVVPMEESKRFLSLETAVSFSIPDVIEIERSTDVISTGNEVTV